MTADRPVNLGLRPRRWTEALFGGHRWRLTLSLLGLIALLTLVAWAATPRGGAVAAEGMVLDFRLRETERGTRTMALVRVGSREGFVSMPPGHACKVGDRISLWRQSSPIRTSYAVRRPGCWRGGPLPG